MNEIWANRLIAGTKAWKDVPASRKGAVEEILRNRVENEIITAEQFKEITGKDY